jgi:DNA repair protein RecO (recombination protein O)
MIKTEGIVLKKRQLLGPDTSLTLLSKEHGKIFVVAKGIKKLTSRRSPHIQTANLIDVILHESRDMYYLQETRLISGFVQVKKDDVKVKSMYALFFILDRLLPERQKEEHIYTVTKSFLVDLAKSKVTNLGLFTIYLQKTLQALGYVHDIKPLEDLIHMTEGIINEKIPLDVI